MNLKQYRKNSGLTLEQAGERIGITKQGWRNLELNWPNIEMRTIFRITEAFEVRIVVSMERDGGAQIVLPPYPEETSTQDDIIDSLDYLPDV